jgi:putative FmdB family regulatory protein
MPTYEFRCPSGHSFERFYRNMADAARELECPECGKLAERQMSGGAGLVFKGSGFYLTDYGRNAHRNEGAGKPTEKAPSESSGEGGGKSESKPESKGGESKAESASSGGSESKRTESKRTESKGDTSAGKSSTSKPDSSSSSSPKKPGPSGGSDG